MAEALLDTDILSEILKAKDGNVLSRARSYLSEHGRFAISVITVTEIVRGFYQVQAPEKAEEFLEKLSGVDVLPVDLETSSLAGRLDGELVSKGLKIGVADVLIAATALHLDRTLVTGNLKHYSRVQELGFPLRLENWRAG